MSDAAPMVPLVHLNGTSGDSLLGELTTASRALGLAIEVLCDAAPNARATTTPAVMTRSRRRGARARGGSPRSARCGPRSNMFSRVSPNRSRRLIAKPRSPANARAPLLVAEFDVTDLTVGQLDALTLEVAAQGEESEHHPTVSVVVRSA